LFNRQSVKKRTRQTARVIKYILLSFIGLVLLYLIAAFVLSRFSIEGINEANSPIEIVIVNSGVHTDFILPKNNSVVNWDTIFPIKNTLKKDSTLQYVSIGWGDRNFFLNTPTWDDLTFNTAINAALGLGEAALHVNYCSGIPINNEYKIIYVSEKQYKNLVIFILENAILENNKPRQIIPHMPETIQSNDAYYESPGSYGLFYTCNSFVNEGLIATGKRAALWTPFAGGIFDHYEE